jgi:hypothetical protein
MSAAFHGGSARVAGPFPGSPRPAGKRRPSTGLDGQEVFG